MSTLFHITTKLLEAQTESGVCFIWVWGTVHWSLPPFLSWGSVWCAAHSTSASPLKFSSARRQQQSNVWLQNHNFQITKWWLRNWTLEECRTGWVLAFHLCSHALITFSLKPSSSSWMRSRRYFICWSASRANAGSMILSALGTPAACSTLQIIWNIG